MRSTILAAFALSTFALAACGGETPAPQPPPPPPLPPPVASTTAAPSDTTPPAPPPKPALAELIPQTMKGLGDAFNAHDAQKMASYFTDDAAVYAYGEGETHSKGDMANGLQMMFTTFTDAKSAATRVWSKGNVVIVEMTWAGTMNGDFMGMKATKKPVGVQRLHIYWLNDDGMVKELHEYGDDAGLMAQMQGKKGAPPVAQVPSNPPEMHIAKGTPDEDKLADWVKGTDDAFNKDDAKAVAAVMADDSDYWLNFTGMPATKGKKDLTKELGMWFKTFPDQKWTQQNAWGIDGYGIVEHTMTGTFKGPFGPVPPTGKPVSGWHQVDIMQPTADGKIQHGWGYMNVVEMMQQAGAMKAPGEKPAAAAPAAGGQAKAAPAPAPAAPKPKK